MADVSIKWFANAILAMGNKEVNLSSDSLMLGIVTAAAVPVVNSPTPHWGGTGATNFAATQVSTLGGYVGPIALSGVSWTNVSGVLTLRANDVVIPAHASGFSNGAYGIIYDNTHPNKIAIGFIEISVTGVASLTSLGLSLDFRGLGTDVLTITPA